MLNRLRTGTKDNTGLVNTDPAGNPQNSYDATAFSQVSAISLQPGMEGCTPSAAQYEAGAIERASSKAVWKGTHTALNSSAIIAAISW